MIYLISQLWIWLLLSALFAGVAGWAFAAERAAPGLRTARRERENLLSDILRLAGEDAGGADPVENERESDAVRRQLELRNGRITELERALEQARARADDLASELAEAQRRGPAGGDNEAELARLRGLVSDYEAEQARTIDVETTPAEPAQGAADDEFALQTWRLRYFEQRVRYLEDIARAKVSAASDPAAAAAIAPVEMWRAREAEARAAYLEGALREVAAPSALAPESETDAEPFAADADVDAMLRWRLLYLERRVAYLQAERGEAAPAAPAAQALASAATPDPDRWKWRARYLEARVRHLESRPPAPPEAAPADTLAEAPQTPPRPSRRGVKPAVLAAARNGAPDDFTLIEGVSLLQQSTLNALGVFHFDQIAAWSEDNAAWIDAYLRLGGRIQDEEWIEQAETLAAEGPAAARRILEEQEAD